jgi:hypothetical protein
MGILDLNTTAIRLMAVFLVIVLSSRKQERSSAGLWAYIAILTCSTAIYSLQEGIDGLSYCLSGAGIALLFVSPMIISGRMTRIETTASLTVGAMLGPFGSLVAIGIVAALYLLQVLLHAESTVFAERFAGSVDIDNDEQENTGSYIASIERKRMRIGDGELDRPAGDKGSGTEPERRDYILTWQSGLALAILMVMMTGIFI